MSKDQITIQTCRRYLIEMSVFEYKGV